MACLSKPATVTRYKPLREVIQIMIEIRVGTLVVVDEWKVLKGYVDVEDIDQNYKKAATVGDVIDTDVFKVRKDTLVRDTIHSILKRGIKNVPVVDEENQLVGIVTRASLVDIVYDTIWGEEEKLESIN